MRPLPRLALVAAALGCVVAVGCATALMGGPARATTSDLAALAAAGSGTGAVVSGAAQVDDRATVPAPADQAARWLAAVLGSAVAAAAATMVARVRPDGRHLPAPHRAWSWPRHRGPPAAHPRPAPA